MEAIPKAKEMQHTGSDEIRGFKDLRGIWKVWSLLQAVPSVGMISGRRSSSFEVRTYQSPRADMFAFKRDSTPPPPTPFPPSLEYVDLERIKRQVRKLKKNALFQDSFTVFDPKQLRRKGKERHIFLFEQALLFSKETKDPEGKIKYLYKNKIKVGEKTRRR